MRARSPRRMEDDASSTPAAATAAMRWRLLRHGTAATWKSRSTMRTPASPRATSYYYDCCEKARPRAAAAVGRRLARRQERRARHAGAAGDRPGRERRRRRARPQGLARRNSTLRRRLARRAPGCESVRERPRRRVGRRRRRRRPRREQAISGLVRLRRRGPRRQEAAQGRPPDTRRCSTFRRPDFPAFRETRRAPRTPCALCRARDRVGGSWRVH